MFRKPQYFTYRTHICKRLMSLGIDSRESILPAYVAWHIDYVESSCGLLKFRRTKQQQQLKEPSLIASNVNDTKTDAQTFRYQS